MESTLARVVNPWREARFPSLPRRNAFLAEVRIWNRVEYLPRIETEPLPDGRRIRFRSDDERQTGIVRLIDSFGGWVPGP
jgi:hypothetical protein